MLDQSATFNVGALRSSFVSAVSALVIIFLIPIIGIHENVLYHVAIFFGNIACPVFLAYSHIGLRQFIFQRLRNFRIQFFELDSSSNNSMSQITRQTEMDEIPHSSAKVASSVQNFQVHFSSVTLNYIAYHRSLNELTIEGDHKDNLERYLLRRHSY